MGNIKTTGRYFFIILFFLALLVYQFTSCGPKPEKRGGKTVIRFSTWEPAGEGIDVLQEVIKMFEVEHPNIKVIVDQVPGANYSGKILTQIAGGQAPDVINIAFHSGDLPIYVEKGALLCLEEFANVDPEFNKDDYFPGCIQACSHKGKLYAIPKDGNPAILFYNKRLFAQAGLSYPDENWTWDDLLDTSRKLTRYDEKGRAISLGGGYSLWHYYTLLVQNNGKVFSDDGKRCLLDSPESIEAFKYALSFHQENLVPDEKTPGFTGISYLDLFPTGRIAMWIFYPYRIGDSVKRIKDFDWDIAPVPIPKGGRRFAELIHVGYAISSTTRYPQETWDFVKWLGGPVVQKMMSCLKYGVPAMKSIAYSDNYGPPPESIKVAADAMGYSELFPTLTSSHEIREKIIRPKLEEVINGIKPLETAIKEIVKEVNDILNQES